MEATAQFPGSGLFAREEVPVGTPEWWKKHRKKAVFEVGKGYRVEGVEGYFDKDGRPIQGPIANERVYAAADGSVQEGLIPGLDPKIQYDRMKSAIGLGPSEQAARAAYGEGERLYREKKYKAAGEKFAVAADRGANSAVEQDAMFMVAECLFFDDRYIKARDAYDALVKEYPSTRHMDTLIEREWAIAQYWEKYEDHNPDWALTPNLYDKARPWFDTQGHAIKTYENIRLNDPTGPRADDAIMATANIYFRIRRYDDADYHYGQLRTQYPRSEHQYEAHLLGLQAKLRKYQGADYDGTPIEEAKVLVKQLRQQFGDKLGADERERLKTVEAQLNYEIALRDYVRAEQYDSTKHYLAARMYYAKLVQNHPDSELAGQARERLAEIADEPDLPPKRMAWFVDLFPESRERSRIADLPELDNGRLRMAEAPAGTSTVQTGSTSPDAIAR